MSKRKNDFPAASPAGQGTGHAPGTGLQEPGGLGHRPLPQPGGGPRDLGWDGMQLPAKPLGDRGGGGGGERPSSFPSGRKDVFPVNNCKVSNEI